MNMITPREFGGLIDYAHRNNQPSGDQLQVIWDFDVIGIQLRGQQHFTTSPCVFALSAYQNNDIRWVVMAAFDRAPNTPTHLFGKLVDDERMVGMFGVIWKATNAPHMVEGDVDLFTNDLLMLRMAKDLWEYP